MLLINKKRFFCLIVMLIILGGFLVAVRRDLEASIMGDLEIKIAVEKTSFLVDEPISLNITYLNKSSTASLTFDTGSTSAFRLILYDKEKNKFGEVDIGSPKISGKQNNLIILEKNQSFAQNVSLFRDSSHIINTPEGKVLGLFPGRYILQLTYLDNVLFNNPRQIYSNEVVINIGKREGYISKQEAFDIAKTEVLRRSKRKKEISPIWHIEDSGDAWKIVFMPLASIPVSNKYNTVVIIDKNTGKIISFGQGK